MTMRFFGTSMDMLTSYLSGMVGRPVEDQTGLTGRCDLTMANSMAMMRRPSVQTGLEDSGSLVFSEVESLGLKLVPGKGPVETLVVDHVEKPSAN